MEFFHGPLDMAPLWLRIPACFSFSMPCKGRSFFCTRLTLLYVHSGPMAIRRTKVNGLLAAPEAEMSQAMGQARLKAAT